MLLLFHCVLYCQSKLICQAFYNIIQHICSTALLNIGCDALSCLSKPQTLLLLSYGTSEMDVKAGERVIKCIQISSDICTDASVTASLCAIYVSLYLCGILFNLTVIFSCLFLCFCFSAALFLWLSLSVLSRCFLFAVQNLNLSQNNLVQCWTQGEVCKILTPND